MSTYRLKISIPESLDQIIVAPLMLLRRLWFSYPFRRISIVNSKQYAIVDPADFYNLSEYPWWLAKRRDSFFRVIRLSNEGNSYRIIAMHRQIMQTELNANRSMLNASLVIDHINHNNLDNRRANLRVVTIAQNNRNRRSSGGVSKYKGVTYHRENKLFIARITINRKRLFLGCFHNDIEAARAYDAAAKKYHGQYACLNFPTEEKQRGLKFILRRAFRVLCSAWGEAINMTVANRQSGSGVEAEKCV